MTKRTESPFSAVGTAVTVQDNVTGTILRGRILAGMIFTERILTGTIPKPDGFHLSGIIF